MFSGVEDKEGDIGEHNSFVDPQQYTCNEIYLFYALPYLLTVILSHNLPRSGANVHNCHKLVVTYIFTKYKDGKNKHQAAAPKKET